MGQVSNVEIGLLSNAIGSLEQSQSQEEFLRNLALVEQRFNEIVNGPGQQPEQGGNIGQMSLEQLQALDPSSLSDDELAAAARRFNELTNAR